MPEVYDVFFNDLAYGSNSRISQWVNVSFAESLIYSVHCSQNCDLVIEWSADDNPYQIIQTETYPLVANIDKKVLLSIKWKFARFSVQNIAIVPCDLKCQLFF